MNICLIYPEKFALLYVKLGMAFKDCFESMGHHVEIYYDVNPKGNFNLEINFNPMYYMRYERIKNRRYVMLQLEHFPYKNCTTSWQEEKWKATLKCLDQYDMVWEQFYDFHVDLYPNQQNLGKFSLGYHEIFDCSHIIKNKDISCSFFGTPSKRRSEIINSISQCKYITHFLDKSSEIARTKINLNIHYSNSKLLEEHRVIYQLMSSKAFIITEDFVGNDDLKTNNCLVHASASELPEVVSHYLKDEAAMMEIAKNGYNYLRKKRRLIDNLRELMEITIE